MESFKIIANFDFFSILKLSLKKDEELLKIPWEYIAYQEVFFPNFCLMLKDHW